MSYKLFFLVTSLLFGLCLSATPTTVHRSLFHIQIPHVQKVSTPSGEPLIQTACKGLGEHESHCTSTLESAPAHQKVNASELAFFALRYVEDHANSVMADITEVSALPDVPPMLQAAMQDCRRQYESVDDLIEDAINAILDSTFPDARKFIEVTMGNIHVCESSLKTSNDKQQKENKDGRKDYSLATKLQELNDFLLGMLKAALNLVKTI